MEYKAYNKQVLGAVVSSFKPSPAPSFWDITQWGRRWESGAADLEKSTPGKIVTAPVRLTEAVLTSAKKTVEQAPDILKTVTKTLPILAVGAVAVGGAILFFKFAGKKTVD